MQEKVAELNDMRSPSFFSKVCVCVVPRKAEYRQPDLPCPSLVGPCQSVVVPALFRWRTDGAQDTGTGTSPVILVQEQLNFALYTQVGEVEGH